MAFYRKTGSLEKSDAVYAPDYSLTVDNKDTHSYPVDGWYWFDSADEAVAVLTVSPLRTIDSSMFKDKFTQAEQLAILIKRDTDQTLKLLMLEVETRSTIDLDSPKTLQGLQYFAAIGCIAASRIPEILA